MSRRTRDLLILGGGAAGSYLAKLKSQSPAFYFAFDEASGTTFKDSMGGSDATIVGTAPTLGRPPVLADSAEPGGKSVGAFTAAAGNYINVPRQANQAFTTQFSLSIWMRTTDASGSERMMMGRIQTGTTWNWYLSGFISGGVYKFRCDLGGTVREWTAAGGNDGNPHHAALVYDGSSLAAYMDGVALTPTTAVTASIGDVAQPIVIGDGSSVSPFGWPGDLDGAAFFTSALSASQIADQNNWGRGIGL